MVIVTRCQCYSAKRKITITSCCNIKEIFIDITIPVSQTYANKKVINLYTLLIIQRPVAYLDFACNVTTFNCISVCD